MNRIEVMEPRLRVYALVNGIAVTKAVQIELFGGRRAQVSDP